jgi:hypothetical protein
VRKFQYYATREEVAHFLKLLGYETVEIYDRHRQEALGYKIVDTTIDLSYDLVLNGMLVGHGMIRLLRDSLDPDPDNPLNRLVNNDLERYERSLKLYRKLYRQFGKPRNY